MSFRFDSNQDRRDTADELLDLAARFREARKRAGEFNNETLRAAFGLAESHMLRLAHRINPERVAAQPDLLEHPRGQVLSVGLRNLSRLFHVPKAHWDGLGQIAN